MRGKLALILLVLLVFGLAACGEDGTPTTSTGAATTGSTAAPPTTGPSSPALAPPGLYEQPNGSVQALGILTHRDLEGGFWAVVDTMLPEEADTAGIVAVIGVTPDMEKSMESYRGQYVSVIGERKDASVYQAGPLVEARTIEVVTDMIVE